MKKCFALILSVLLLFAVSLPVFSVEDSCAVTIPVIVDLTGVSNGGNCTVVLSADKADCPMPSGSTDGKKTIFLSYGVTADFGQVEYSEPGTYNYTVYQVPGSDNTITYDRTVYNLVVTVTYEDDKLQVAVTVSAKETGDKVDKITFKNEGLKADETVSVVKTADSNNKTKCGDTIEYSLTVTNNGTETVKNICVRDYIPANTTYVAGSATHGGEYASIDGKNQITWNIAELAPGETVKLSFKVTVDECDSGTVITNTASYSVNKELSSSDPGDPATNTNTVETEIHKSFSDFIKEDGPFTGDDSSMYMWILVMVAFAGAAMASSVVIVKKRKKSK